MEADDLMATMVAIAEVVAQATNLLKVASENGFGGGVLSSTFVLCTTGNDCASADDDAVPRILRMPITENAVEKSVKKNPATTTAPTLRTSNEEPRLCASGKVTNDGTKKTGNHLAKTAAPGLNKLYKPSPSDSLTVQSVTKSVNNVPHPASDDGNDMDNDLSSLRNPMSSATKATVDDMEAISEGPFLADSGASLTAVVDM